MVRIVVIAVTAAACVLAGASAGLLAFAVEVHTSLLDPDIAIYGAGWSCVGVVVVAVWLWYAERKYLLRIAVIGVAATWLATFVCVWLRVVSGLG
jgi:hypothetical protein